MGKKSLINFWKKNHTFFLMINDQNISGNKVTSPRTTVVVLPAHGAAVHAGICHPNLLPLLQPLEVWTDRKKKHTGRQGQVHSLFFRILVEILTHPLETDMSVPNVTEIQPIIYRDTSFWIKLDRQTQPLTFMASPS